MKSFAAAALAASLMFAGAALAQPSSDMGPQPSPLHNDGPYAGASPAGFYDVGQRIDRLQTAITSGVLSGGQARRATSQLGAIRSDLHYRIQRHNGTLRDWDRELINQKLDRFVAQYPALKS